jgi:OHCU decarboxylase
VRLDELNTLDASVATGELLRCCGSRRWAAEMAVRRPFTSLEALMRDADRLWTSLEPADWLEAFAAHPRIGAPAPEGSARTAASSTVSWSADEQSGVTEDSRSRFAALNRQYEGRFGHIFIVCASGKTAAEMLRLLEQRMENNPADELRAAAEEQRKITRLRLSRLLT